MVGGGLFLSREFVLIFILVNLYFLEYLIIESKNKMSLISNVRNGNLQQQKNREYVK